MGLKEKQKRQFQKDPQLIIDGLALTEWSYLNIRPSELTSPLTHLIIKATVCLLV